VRACNVSLGGGVTPDDGTAVASFGNAFCWAVIVEVGEAVFGEETGAPFANRHVHIAFSLPPAGCSGTWLPVTVVVLDPLKLELLASPSMTGNDHSLAGSSTLE
jgi:hypothetical protein